jgi:hypothetical protein
MNRREMLVATGTGGLAFAAVGAMGLVEGCNAAGWVQTAINDLPTIVSIAESIISIVGAAQGAADPAALALAQKAAGEANTDLQTLQALIAGYNASTNKTTDLGKIDALLLSVQSNLSAVEGALHISNPAMQAAISAAVSSALVIIVALQSLIPPPPVPAPVPATATAVRTNQHATLYAAAKSNSTAVVIKAGYNAALAAAGASQFAVK